jgi:hypothetical protein
LEEQIGNEPLIGTNEVKKRKRKREKEREDQLLLSCRSKSFDSWKGWRFKEFLSGGRDGFAPS